MEALDPNGGGTVPSWAWWGKDVADDAADEPMRTDDGGMGERALLAAACSSVLALLLPA